MKYWTIISMLFSYNIIICNGDAEDAESVLKTEVKSQFGKDNVGNLNKTSSGTININSTSQKQEKSEDAETKTKQILGKITNVIEKALSNGKTLEDKKAQVEKAKQQILSSIDKKSNNSQSLKDAIEEGFALTSRRLLANISRRTMTEERNINSTTEVTITGFTKDFRCGDVRNQVCIDLKTIDVFRCLYDDTTLSTQQVCDGAIDCPDGSDEKNCIKQVISKVHSATGIMSKIELARSCFNSLSENALVSHQGELLYNLLNKEIEFLQKYDKTDRTTTMLPQLVRKSSADVPVPYLYHPQESVDQIVAEVAVVVRTFATALSGALCFNPNTNPTKKELDKEVEMLTSDNIDKEVKSLVNEKHFSAKFCMCNGPYCANETCVPRCKRICYLTFTFGRYNCRAARNQNSVPFDVVCDGKFDCFDRTDENGCAGTNSLAKFEGSRIFDKVLKIIKSKTTSVEYQPVRNLLVELYSDVHTLHKHCMGHDLRPDIVKIVRNNCIRLFKMIYVEMMEHIKAQEGEMVYMFLYSLNEKLLEAMKKTHTGNEKVEGPVDCICRSGECTEVMCSQDCVHLCRVKYLLTSYQCTSSNLSLPLDTVCNGKINCPEAEDELNCKQDVCHSRHVKGLQQSIEHIGDNYKSTILGDAIDTWKAKVSAQLLLAESQTRLTPKFLRASIAHILNDLSLTYGNLAEYHKDENNHVVKKFMKLSQRIIETIRVCNN